MSRVASSDVQRRRRAIDDARKSSELEGSRSTDATRADQDAYVKGEIEIEQPVIGSASVTA